MAVYTGPVVLCSALYQITPLINGKNNRNTVTGLAPKKQADIIKDK